MLLLLFLLLLLLLLMLTRQGDGRRCSRRRRRCAVTPPAVPLPGLSSLEETPHQRVGDRCDTSSNTRSNYPADGTRVESSQGSAGRD